MSNKTQLYKKALETFKNSAYEQSSVLFQEYIVKYPTDIPAKIKLIEIYYIEKSYEVAHTLLKEIAEKISIYLIMSMFGWQE